VTIDFIQAEMPRLGKLSIRRAVPVTTGQEGTEGLVREYCRRQWSKPRLSRHETPLVASRDERSCHLDGEVVRRLVVTLRPAGCGWGAKGGGCIMCGHYLASSGQLLDSHDLLSQWPRVIQELEEGQIPVLCVYNGGNILNPDEVDFNALIDLCRRLSAKPFFRRLVLESRPEYTQPHLIQALLDNLAPSQSIMLGVGIESANDAIRHLCLNKGLSWSDFKSVPHNSRCLQRFYCFFGAPFLTEAEMLTDTFDSILRFRQEQADDIHVESATIQRGTLLNRLWRNDSYDLPNLWSLVFLLRALPGGLFPYVSPFQHFPMPYQIPTTCGLCESSVVAAFDAYNRRLDPSCFDNLACACLDSWALRLQETDPRPLEERIAATLGEANCALMPATAGAGG
jgi:hypothetical protein